MVWWGLYGGCRTSYSLSYSVAVKSGEVSKIMSVSSVLLWSFLLLLLWAYFYRRFLNSIPIRISRRTGLGRLFVNHGILVVSVTLFVVGHHIVSPWHKWLGTGIASLSIVALMGEVTVLRRRRAQKFLRGVRDAAFQVCPACGYSLQGHPQEGQCPECGKSYIDLPGRWESILQEPVAK